MLEPLASMLEKRTAEATLLAESVRTTSRLGYYYTKNTVDSQLIETPIPQFKDEAAPFVEVCSHATDCSDSSCELVHFKLRELPQTEVSLGDCSYLNACHHLDVCRYKHYRPATPSEEQARRMELERSAKAKLKPVKEKLLPPQWIDCDLRKLDMTVLGKFDVIMADPPWDSEHLEVSFWLLLPRS